MKSIFHIAFAMLLAAATAVSAATQGNGRAPTRLSRLTGSEYMRAVATQRLADGGQTDRRIIQIYSPMPVQPDPLLPGNLAPVASQLLAENFSALVRVKAGTSFHNETTVRSDLQLCIQLLFYDHQYPPSSTRFGAAFKSGQVSPSIDTESGTFTITSKLIDRDDLEIPQSSVTVRAQYTRSTSSWAISASVGTASFAFSRSINKGDELGISAALEEGVALAIATTFGRYWNLTLPNRDFQSDGILSSTGENARSSSGVARGPKLIRTTTPVFPEELRREGSSGTVTLELVIDSQGRVTKVNSLEATDRRFELPAIEAARHWRFRPALDSDGEPIRTRVIQTIQFSMND